MPTVQEALDRIWSDESLKNKLISNPKPVLREFGLNIPDNVTVHVHENTPSVFNAVLPKKPAGPVSVQSADPVAKVIERAWSDSGFKSRLLANPNDAAAEMGVKLPGNVKLKVWENTDSEEHLVLPLNPRTSELSDVELEAVAGGGLSKGVQTATGCGVASGVAGGVAAALFFTAVGSAIAGGVSAAAGAGSAAGGAIASGGGKC